MTLEKERDPIASFIECTRAYTASPGVIAGMALDDATVVLKRHLLSILPEDSVIEKLNELGKAIRNQEADTIQRVIDEVIEVIENL